MLKKCKALLALGCLHYLFLAATPALAQVVIVAGAQSSGQRPDDSLCFCRARRRA